MTEPPVGQRCAGVRRFRHLYPGAAPSTFGPIEFSWQDGTFLTFDAKADWNLSISFSPWSDPYGRATAAEREVLLREVGLWEPGPVPDELGVVAGQVLRSTYLVYDEVGELMGQVLVFDTCDVRVHVPAGDLEVEVEQHRRAP